MWIERSDERLGREVDTFKPIQYTFFNISSIKWAVFFVLLLENCADKQNFGE